MFLKQTWNMLAVSVLYNFNPNDEVQLKQYAKKLREEVSCSLSQEDVSYEAKVDVSELRRPKDTDHPVIEVNNSSFYLIDVNEFYSVNCDEIFSYIY